MTPEVPDKRTDDERATVGEQLRQAREHAHLSIVQAAQQLHLDRGVLEALEANRFDNLGAPVFAKGHLRKYATHLGLDINDLLAGYYQSASRPELPPLVTNHETILNSSNTLRNVGILFAVLAAALIIVGVYWWLGWSEDSPTARVVRPQEAPLAEDTSGSDTVPDLPQRSAELVGNSASDEPAAAPQNLEESQGVATPAPVLPSSADELTLRLEFTNDSWVEIEDANGRRLFYGLGRAGVVEEMDGVAPIDVLVGDVFAVSLTVDGERWAIPGELRPGRTARFVVTPR
ncbi:MAG: RodZ domain-containing protein [Gammaproteobacteria bacterium]